MCKKKTKEKQNKKSNISKGLETFLATLIILVLFAFMIHPVLFDYRQIPLWHKILMIASTAIFYLTIIPFIIIAEISVKKSGNVERKDKIKLRILYTLILLCSMYLSLNYFSSGIWGTLSIFFVISFFIMVLFGSYSLVANNFSALLNKEKVPMFILAVAFVCINMALMLNKNREIADTLLKVAIGIGYVVFIAVFINLTVLSRKNVNSKHVVTLLIICIIIPVVVLITFPFYVQWCGLSGDRFTTFVSVYAAMVSGGLTLVGVAWTIKHSEKTKHDEELSKAKPLFTFNFIDKGDNFDVNNVKMCITPNPGGIASYAELENSDNSTFVITRFYFENKWHVPMANNVVLPRNNLLILLWRKNCEEYPIMEVEDICGRKYFYILIFMCLPTKEQIEYCVLAEIRKISLTELENRKITIE